MKFLLIYIYLIFVINFIFAKKKIVINVNISNKKSIKHIKEKQREVINEREIQNNECQYINSLFDEDVSYDCCEKIGITCSEGHIISM